MLTDQKVKTVQPKDKQFKISDEKGLYLLVKPNGGKYWRLKYRLAGKEKVLSIGVYPDISLKQARRERDQAKELIRAGIDPVLDKQEQKLKKIGEAKNSFELVAREWMEKQRNRWSEDHAHRVMTSLEKDIFSALGHKPINEITAPLLLMALRKVESRGAHEVAQRLMQRCGAVFAYGIATGVCERNPAADLAGSLTPPKQKNYKALSKKDMPGFLSKLDQYQGHLQTKLALKLLIYTFVRTGELRGANWSEIDFDGAEWIIPAERMKMKTEHIVPLSRQAIEIFKQMQELNGRYDYVFTSIKDTRQPISSNTMIYALYRMGYHSRATVHGFRALASTTLNELGYHHDAIERQLAHAERNKVRAAYNRAEYLPERKKIMQDWANIVDSWAGDNKVIPGNFRQVG